jgi:hypothetical protein
MKSIWKPTLAFMVILLLLTGGGLVAGKYTFASWERILAEDPPGEKMEAGAKTSGFSDKEYKKIRLAFNSFDLAAGLTKNDLEAIPVCNTYYFAFAWLCLGSVFILKKPRKRRK